nr:hypothetical protein [uncultured Lysinibacillus sp.]
MSFFGVFVSTAITVCRVAVAVATSVSAIATAVSAVSHAFGLTKTTNPEQLGDKALQADEDGIHPDNYDTFQEYLDAVEEFEIDPEKSKKWTKEEKEMRALQISSTLLIDKFGKNAETMIYEMAKNPEHFTIERSKAYLEIAEDKGIDIENIKLLLDNELDDYKDMLEADNAMYDIEKTINPQLSEFEHTNKLIDLRKY